MGTSRIVVEPAVGGSMRGGVSTIAAEGEEGLDLFLRRRSATLVGLLGESGVQNGSIKNLSVGSTIKGNIRTDDFLDAEMGKHDYDWLLTPPGTPIFPSSDSSENQLSSTGKKNPSTAKSTSTSRASRDIRQSMGGIRANSIFPHSIRSGNAPKSRPARGSEPIVPVTNDEPLSETRSCSGIVLETAVVAEKQMSKDCVIAKESDFDPYGSSRYDAMLLKEDLKNTNWLHSVEDKSDQSPVFDQRFEPPPEPFSPL